MRGVRKKLETVLLMLMIVTIICCIITLMSTQRTNPLDEKKRIYKEEKITEIEEREARRDEKEEGKERNKEIKLNEGNEGKIISEGKIRRKSFWVNEIEEYARSETDMEAMEEEMKRRKRRVEERCGEVLTEEEEKKEINSREFLISKKYKLIWCNIFKSASSTWMYYYLLMAGRTKEQLEYSKTPPVEAARQLYPRPSQEELLSYLGKAGDGGEAVGSERYLSFIIVREPFQRLLSAYRDKIEKNMPYYKPLRCKIVLGEEKPQQRGYCSPTFPQFVDYVLKVEEEGGQQNEHWAPYYKFCSTCQVNFDLVLRFESLQRDEAYLLEKVSGLSDVVSPKMIHSSHANYTTLLAHYYSQLTPRQMIGLVKMYQPDFWLFGYNERPYLDLVL